MNIVEKERRGRTDGWEEEDRIGKEDRGCLEWMESWKKRRKKMGRNINKYM